MYFLSVLLVVYLIITLKTPVCTIKEEYSDSYVLEKVKTNLILVLLFPFRLLVKVEVEACCFKTKPV